MDDNGTPATTPGLDVLVELAAALSAALGAGSEVVVHDLSRLPRSIVAVHGEVTGRRCGDPPTNTLLRLLASERPAHEFDYRTHAPDGRPRRSSTLVLHEAEGPAHALCINVDLSAWESIRSLAEAANGTDAAQPEAFVQSVRELKDLLLRDAISATGVPVDLMRKEHKLDVVRRLHAAGLFLLRDGVEATAEALDVSRFTIYNYLREGVGKDAV